jgi:hypothetical protein
MLVILRLMLYLISPQKSTSALSIKIKQKNIYKISCKATPNTKIISNSMRF